MRIIAASVLASVGLSACVSDFWDMDPPAQIALDPALVGALFIDGVEVRSAFYNPPDAFSDIFVPAFRNGATACFDGRRPVRAIVFIHALDRSGDLIAGDGRVRLPGSVDLHDAKGRVIVRYPIRADLPATGGDLTARRTAAAETFGEQLCEQITVTR
ncbi:hypothetical protein GCM10009116_25470 [Brevundimonas basaltis]|uniref:Lipoprotein n=1 Tax=Brevundimonas basaltis TaxID=472166 RepID=A0A7W8HX84_9CAUL|nr:hypothetical protein [Brevundimonas basaltis]MBB5291562.1 hypothetical protein [Brevundimonas basaltis]